MTRFWRELKYYLNKPLFIYNDSITYEDFVNSSFSTHSYDLSNGDYDVKIEVGEEPDVRIVWAHSSILKERSMYFKVALSSNWTRKQNDIIVFKKPNLSYQVFASLVKYLYTGRLSLQSISPLTALGLLQAADELCLQELLDYIQQYLLRNPTWLEKNFAMVYSTCLPHSAFTRLQEYCNHIVEDLPYLIFASEDFTLLDDELLQSLLKRDEIAIPEDRLWIRLLDWGIAQANLHPNKSKWTLSDWQSLQSVLDPFISLIRFPEISQLCFVKKVYPYRQLLSHDNFQGDLTLPRLGPKPSTRYPKDLLDNQQLTWISKYIGGKDPSYSELTSDKFNSTPYKFKLILDGCRDGYTSETFHKLCDNQGPTIIVMSIKETKEIIGGFNPRSWNSSDVRIKTSYSFLFTLTNGKLVVSRVAHPQLAVHCHGKFGPIFGDWDLVMYGDFKKDKECFCRRHAYTKHIRALDSGKFSVDQFQVWHVKEASS
ncbi:4294_t:CDS:2 [Paraglomus occultum]|uniref:4294_t:CDS:1 n=1 Tax=Paraglomus occultum TaxID=144539 RepID=A0A9N9G0R1_9GLOM|nr:4294_t:CDS:2 [Paraglomus occultum]